MNPAEDEIIEAVKKVIPMAISEAEPKRIGGK